MFHMAISIPPTSYDLMLITGPSVGSVTGEAKLFHSTFLCESCWKHANLVEPNLDWIEDL